jgi:Tfp pilus assembly protein PilX
MKADRGFVLPTSLLVLTLLTVMLTAAFVVVTAEYRSTDNSMAGTRSLSLAQAGLQSYFASTRGLQPSDSYDSVRYTYTNGYTDVVARKMRSATTGITPWVVRATGVTTDPLLTAQVTAKRTVGQLAQLNPATLITPRAALTALNGISITGGAGGTSPIDGNNFTYLNPAGCVTPSPSTAANNNGAYVPVPTSTYYQGAAPENGAIITAASLGALYDSTHVNWPAIMAGNFSPDWVGAAGLPAPGNTAWSVGYVNGDLTIPSNGGVTPRKGVLIVTGDVTMADGAYWAGVIIAGGRIIGTGDFLVQGWAITGLNCAPGAGTTCPAATTLAKYNSGVRSITWSYCWSWAAINSLATMVPIKNTFIDNWAGY